MADQSNEMGMVERRKAFEQKYAVDGNGCWIWQGATKRYGYFRLGKGTKAHRAAYQLFRGPIPAGMLVCHQCDVMACVNPEHLFLGTNLDNNRDRHAKGRSVIHKIRPEQKPRGSRHGLAKLSEEDVLHIRSSSRLTQRNLARLYGVCVSTITDITRRITWTHL